MNEGLCKSLANELTKNEQALFRTVAYWLRGQMMSQLKDVSPSPDLLHDLAQSNYEISCRALAQAGMFTSEGDYWRVQEPENEKPVLVGQYTRSDLNQLLDGLACHSDYVNELYQHHEAVTPTQDALRDVCQALTECGYMRKISAKSFEWTDNFGPWLVRNGGWDLDEFEAAPETEVMIVLAAIPDKAKDWLSGSLCRHPPHFVRCFFAQWIDGKWEDEQWRKEPNDDWDLCIAAGLYAQLHGQ